MSISRKPQISQYSDNFLAIGDLHWDFTTSAADQNQRATRRSILSLDLVEQFSKNIAKAVVQVGDQGQVCTDAELDAYIAWRNALNSGSFGIPFYEIPGNHDLMGNNASGGVDIRTPNQWAAYMGLPSKDRYVDIGRNLRLLLVSPAQDASIGYAHIRRLTVDQATLAWCDARIGETTRQCVIVFHSPLYGTVGPLDGSAFSSYDERWHTHEDAGHPISDMISQHPNFAAWIAGHTHPDVREVDVVKQVTYGSVKFAAISCPGFMQFNPGIGYISDRCIYVHVSVYETKVEVRYRDAGTGQWIGPANIINTV